MKILLLFLGHLPGRSATEHTPRSLRLSARGPVLVEARQAHALRCEYPALTMPRMDNHDWNAAADRVAGGF
jgi:hypothetical protein